MTGDGTKSRRGKGGKAAMNNELRLWTSPWCPKRGYSGTVISLHTATQAQIAEPLFCNFHNEAFEIIIKLKGKGRKMAPRELRIVPQGPLPSLSPSH